MATSDFSSKPQLYLVRHGETAWSLTGQHTGVTDLPLTPRGEERARGLVGRLHTISFAKVLTSPRVRAIRTCELAGLGESAEVEPDLAEWNYGDYEGRRTVDIQVERPDWNIFRDGCPGGESPEQISERADRLIARLRELSGNIALFSHGHFGCVLGMRWIGSPIATGEHFPLGVASISILGYESNHPDVPVVRLWNAAANTIIP